jgi:hypothetical protein
VYTGNRTGAGIANPPPSLLVPLPKTALGRALIGDDCLAPPSEGFSRSVVQLLLVVGSNHDDVARVEAEAVSEHRTAFALRRCEKVLLVDRCAALTSCVYRGEKRQHKVKKEKVPLIQQHLL